MQAHVRSRSLHGLRIAQFEFFLKRRISTLKKGVLRYKNSRIQETIINDNNLLWRSDPTRHNLLWRSDPTRPHKTA